MRSKNIYYSLLVFVATSLTSCSSQEAAAPPLTESEPSQFELYIARGSLFNPAEFEQYKYFADKLFIECGLIRAGRQVPKTRFMAKLTPEQSKELKESSLRSYQANKGKESQLEEPGTEFGFADPGQVLLTIRFPGEQFSLKTSLDSVSDGESGNLKVLQSFTKTVRAIALSLPEIQTKGNLCGNKSFYGL